jgi:hypothetical protein
MDSIRKIPQLFQTAIEVSLRDDSIDARERYAMNDLPGHRILSKGQRRRVPPPSPPPPTGFYR